jgi:hypothetical protein
MIGAIPWRGADLTIWRGDDLIQQLLLYTLPDFFDNHPQLLVCLLQVPCMGGGCGAEETGRTFLVTPHCLQWGGGRLESFDHSCISPSSDEVGKTVTHFEFQS